MGFFEEIIIDNYASITNDIAIDKNYIWNGTRKLLEYNKPYFDLSELQKYRNLANKLILLK